MSLTGPVENLLGGLTGTPDVRRVLAEVFRYLVPNTQYGPVTSGGKATNFHGSWVTGTTPASTGEFSIAHSLGRAPYLAVPVLRLDVVGAQTVPLEVPRVADTRRVYLKSASTSAAFSLYVE